MVWHCTVEGVSTGAPDDQGESLPAKEPQPQQGALTVLIVEDEILIRLSIADFLRERGLAVFEAASADEARAILNADLPIDMVFSDIHMPGGESGLALAQWLRAEHPGVVVMLTSAIATAAETGAFQFVSKPYEPEQVHERILDLLAQRAQRA